MATQQMDIRLAMQLDGSGDINIADGDFDLGECTAQHQERLILDGKGDYKQNPTIAVGVMDYLHDDTLDELPGAIATQFSQDGMEVKGLQLTGGKIVSDSYYP